MLDSGFFGSFLLMVKPSGNLGSPEVTLNPKPDKYEQPYFYYQKRTTTLTIPLLPLLLSLLLTLPSTVLLFPLLLLLPFLLSYCYYY